MQRISYTADLLAKTIPMMMAKASAEKAMSENPGANIPDEIKNTMVCVACPPHGFAKNGNKPNDREQHGASDPRNPRPNDECCPDGWGNQHGRRIGPEPSFLIAKSHRWLGQLALATDLRLQSGRWLTGGRLMSSTSSLQIRRLPPRPPHVLNPGPQTPKPYISWSKH